MSSREEVRQRLVGMLLEFDPDLPAADLTPDRRLLDLAIDSLTLMAVLLDVEDGFGIRLSEQHLAKITTIGDFEGAIIAVLERNGSA